MNYLTLNRLTVIEIFSLLESPLENTQTAAVFNKSKDPLALSTINNSDRKMHHRLIVLVTGEVLAIFLAKACFLCNLRWW